MKRPLAKALLLLLALTVVFGCGGEQRAAETEVDEDELAAFSARCRKRQT